MSLRDVIKFNKVPRSSRTWMLVTAFVVSGFLAYYWDATSPRSSSNKASEVDVESASTFIPAGYVLIPIEVSNFESLDSILGQFGVVDLYLPSDEPKKRALKVAHHLKILRAPLNPSHFAVLARESESAQLVAHNGPFTVVVQNPSAAGTGLVTDHTDDSDAVDDDSSAGHGDNRTSRKKRSRITVEVIDGKDG